MCTEQIQGKSNSASMADFLWARQALLRNGLTFTLDNSEWFFPFELPTWLRVPVTAGLIPGVNFNLLIQLFQVSLLKSAIKFDWIGSTYNIELFSFDQRLDSTEWNSTSNIQMCWQVEPGSARSGTTFETGLIRICNLAFISPFY